nr:uncharacterized protein LOC112285526 [Physcomitrium patens]|eukprot:XP_024382203.1 uncharacterized protein LOC112285526 [Physcomitrella patens]
MLFGNHLCVGMVCAVSEYLHVMETFVISLAPFFLEPCFTVFVRLGLFWDRVVFCKVVAQLGFRGLSTFLFFLELVLVVRHLGLVYSDARGYAATGASGGVCVPGGPLAARSWCLERQVGCSVLLIPSTMVDIPRAATVAAALTF